MNPVLVMSIAAALLGAGKPAEIELSLAGGGSVHGIVVELSDRQIRVETAAGVVEHPIARLLDLKPVSPGDTGTAAAAPIQVTWLDGTSLPATAYQVAGGRATIAAVGPDGQPLSVESGTAAISFVGLQAEALAAHGTEWQALVADLTEHPAKSDRIVVAKREALDYVEGVLGDVTEATIAFETDGETLAVKRARAAALIYAHGATPAFGSAAQATLTNGTRVLLHLVELAAGVLNVTTPAGLELKLPWSMLARIDFSQGKVVALGDLRPELMNWSPYFAPAELPAALAAHYAPRIDAAFDGGPMRIAGQEFARGVALRSRTELVYRLPDKFKRFTTVAGIDDAVRPQGNVQLAIYGDDRLLFEATLDGRSPGMPLELDLQGVNRLKFRVGFGADLDIGDQLDLGEAKLEK
ncbi:MAG: NPCBM/NEW2 domain-containing protein [Pirellulales bacterium]|nr:NPCBM/NEW2 domain-containing protein [Pirellulales bacterium]